jgi:hypothetical protein
LGRSNTPTWLPDDILYINYFTVKENIRELPTLEKDRYKLMSMKKERKGEMKMILISLPPLFLDRIVLGHINYLLVQVKLASKTVLN